MTVVQQAASDRALIGNGKGINWDCFWDEAFLIVSHLQGFWVFRRLPIILPKNSVVQSQRSHRGDYLRHRLLTSSSVALGVLA